MCAKQVLRSVLQSAHISHKASARVVGCSPIQSIARSFNADLPVYLTHSAFSLRPNHVVRALGASIYVKCTYTPDINAHFCQNDIQVRRRDLTTHTIEDAKNQLADPAVFLKESNSHTLHSFKSEAVAESTHAAESAFVLRQDAFLLEADNGDSTTTEEIDEDVDAEREFYKLIQAEDSPDELLSMLMNLEEVFPPSDPRVSHTCLRLAKLLNDTNQKPEKIIDYARQAFHNFDSSRFLLESASALFLVGLGHYKMGDPKEAVAVLEKCAFQMAGLELPSAKKQELSGLQYSVQIVLGQAKVSLGWNLDGLLELRKGLSTMEKFLPPESPHLGLCYQETASAVLQAKEPKEALSLCGKALSILSKCLGPSSLEVADIRLMMLRIHYELNDYKRAISECQLAVQILEKLGERDKAICLELESMQAYFLLEKFDEAVAKLNEIVKRTQQEDPLHIEALILLVGAFIGLKDNVAATKYSQRALNSLEKQELNLDSAKTLIRLSTGFQQLQNFEQALAISQRALDVFEKCTGDEAQACIADARGYRGSLFLYLGKPNEAIPHLEKALLIKKGVYGAESGELLDLCNHLGVAYANVKRVDEALAIFQEAKMILNTSSNGADLISIYIYNNLSLTCILSGRNEEAIELKRHAVQLLRKAGKDVLLPLGEAGKELERLVEATECGQIASKSHKQVMQQMLPSCMTSCRQDNAIT